MINDVQTENQNNSSQTHEEAIKDSNHNIRDPERKNINATNNPVSTTNNAHRGKYTEEEKQLIIDKSNKIGILEAAKEIGIDSGTIKRWFRERTLQLPAIFKPAKERIIKAQISDYPGIRKCREFTAEDAKRIDELKDTHSAYKIAKILGLSIMTVKCYLNPQLRIQENERNRLRYQNNEDVRKKWSERAREYRKKHLDIVKARAQKAFSSLNERREYFKSRYNELDEQRIAHNAACRETHKRRIKTDPIYKHKEGIRQRFKIALKKLQQTPLISRDDIGCDWQTYKAHMESRFNPWMTWDNHGSGYYDPQTYKRLSKSCGGVWRLGWEVDHIIPLEFFGERLKTKEGQCRACHYTNLRPLDGYLNRQYNKVAQQLLKLGYYLDNDYNMRTPENVIIDDVEQLIEDSYNGQTYS